MPVVEYLLTLLASAQGGFWPLYETIPGIQWHGALEIPPSSRAHGSHVSRSGGFLLAGFGVAWLPDLSADDGIREGNEGEAGVTLIGDAHRVHEIVVVKYYPSDDMPGLLRRQLGDGSVVMPGVGEDETGGERHRIVLAAGEVIDVSVHIDEEGGSGGPGSTTMMFHRGGPGDTSEAGSALQ